MQDLKVKQMLDIKEISVPGFEKIIEVKNSEAGLHAFIAVHNTTLGPALGGARIYPYPNREAALTDVLRLAKGMTYKSAVIAIGLGGGKSVIIADPKSQKSKEMLHAFGDAINLLKGSYIAAEDLGSTSDDMVNIREATPYVAALPTEKSSGDPSRFTSWGIFRGMQAVAMKLWGSPSLRGKTVAIQGVGNVGSRLANLLFWEGVELILTDLDSYQVHNLALKDGAREIKPEEIYGVKCDIFAPCAMGGILNKDTIPKLNCQAVAGAANNQLLNDEDGERLLKRGILYAPDFVINSGGLINAAAEFDPGGYKPTISRDKVNHIYDTLLQIFEHSEHENKSTNQIADAMAEHNLRHKIGQRQIPIKFNT